MNDEREPIANLPRNPNANGSDAVQHATADLIIEVMNGLMYEGDYETAMTDVLITMSRAIHGDRILILEQRRRLDSRFVEWCAEGASPRIAAVKKVSDAALDNFVQQFRGQNHLIAGTLDELGITDERQRAYFDRFGVKSMLSLPLYENGRFVGCFVVDNYTTDEGFDCMRLLETIGPCMATAISNHQLLEELEWSGTHDALTGLLNRRGIDAATTRALEGRLGKPFAIALIDIDDFKAINDLHGHTAGDEALCALARKLAEALPEGSIIGRNGGDELFAMVAGDETANVAEPFCAFTGTPLEITDGGKPISITTSLGFATYPDQAQTLSGAYRLADAALYAAKLAGKAQAIRYSDALDFRYRSQLGFTPRDIAENIPAGIVVYHTDGNGEILFANKWLADLFACNDLNDFMSYVQGCYRYIMHPDDGIRVYKEVVSKAAVTEVGKQFTVDFRIIAKDGTVKHVAQNGRLVEVEGTGVVVYSTIIDRAGHTLVSAGATS